MTIAKTINTFSQKLENTNPLSCSIVSIHAQAERSISDQSTHSHSNKLHNPSQLIAQQQYQQHP